MELEEIKRRGRVMIECRPLSICSWGFKLSGENFSAETDIDWVGESGEIAVNGRVLTVTKTGIFSPEWTLAENGITVATATKNSMLTRSFKIGSNDQSFDLEALSPFARSMSLVGAGISMNIEPVHPFTRRATISGTSNNDAVVAFAFWLTLLIWRRQSNAASSS